jgi:hypothetical protein
MKFFPTDRPAAFLAALAVAVFPQLATPQSAAAETGKPVASMEIPKSDCGDKPEFPGRLAADKAKLAWVKNANAYLECLKKHAEGLKAAATRYQDAANAAIKQLNEANMDIQATAKAASE